MNRKDVLKAFTQYDNGIRPDAYRNAKTSFVLNSDNVLYPAKILWALAKGVNNTGKYHTNDAITELKDLGFTVHKIVDSTESTNLEQQVNDLISGPNEVLRRGVADAPKKPTRSQVLTYQFNRSPYVVAATLKRANGICEQCQEEAPFTKRNTNTPYLEVHHKTWLSNDGEDTIENARALCPNCHRKAHYG